MGPNRVSPKTAEKKEKKEEGGIGKKESQLAGLHAPPPPFVHRKEKKERKGQGGLNHRNTSSE